MCTFTDINASKMASIPAEKLPSYVAELHRDNCFNAEEEYEVSGPFSLSPSLSHSHIDTQTKTYVHMYKHTHTN